MSIDSDATDEEGKHEDYSEWRLFGSAFQNAVVNEGFQIRDFQSSRGGAAVSVIDPKTLGRLRKEASVIQNNKIRYRHAVVLPLWFCCIGLLDMVPDDAIPLLVIAIVGSLGFVFLLHYVVGTFLQKKADAKLTALVDSYQHVFLEEYGVDLSFVPHDSFGNPCINLRRPHQLVVRDVGDSKPTDGRYPPIYLARLIPGEIHIDAKEHDATSLNVDAEIWTLLRSTHKKMIKQDYNPAMTCLLTILLLLGWGVGSYWASKIRFGFFFQVALIYIQIWLFEFAMDNRNLSVYEEVTKAVNQALQQKGKGNSFLTVEFHSSERPGREGKLGRRYQFVTPDLSRSNELV